MLRATGSDPAIASVEPDMLFHAAFIEALGSQKLERMYRSFVDEVRLCMAQVQGQGQGRSLLGVKQIADEHREVLVTSQHPTQTTTLDTTSSASPLLQLFQLASREEENRDRCSNP